MMRSMIRLFALILISQAPTALARDPATNVYFGDLHLHTRFSNDAFAFTTERTPDDAYRYAKGEAVPHIGGQPIRLAAALDFLAVTDHASSIGVLQSLIDPALAQPDHKVVKMVRSDDPMQRVQAYFEWTASLRGGAGDEIFENPELEARVWREIVTAADRHYAPGKFTTFAAYEWTSSPDGQTLHRNVIFADTEDLPLPFSAVDSQNPEDLWRYLERQRTRGLRVLAIPHNMNISGGLAFQLSTWDGKPFSAHYAARRTWNEPLVEIVQHKGASETHPALSPNDEFADFALYPDRTPPELKEGTSGRYAREALLQGLRYQAREGFNPFEFGFVGASDFHSGASAIEENNMTGSYGPGFGSTPQLRRFQERPWNDTPLTTRSAGGLSAIWARENTRQELFDALRRRESYATTGTRIRVRLFAGWNYPADLAERDDWVSDAYAGGIPMGGVLEGAQGEAPRLLVWASKDPASGNLDRIQVVKGWAADGRAHEKVYDVALADGRTVAADGTVASVGNTVDVATATFTNDIGDADLATLWQDPDFDPALPAFYYARVLEIPTPRWSTYDAVSLGIEPPPQVPPSIQERAYTSPIWYRPRGDGKK